MSIRSTVEFGWRCGILLFVLAGMNLTASITVTLTPSPASPQPVGTILTWNAGLNDTSAGSHEYRFSVASPGGPASIVRDFHTSSSFQWTPSFTEGTYTVSVIARNLTTSATAQVSRQFVVSSRVVGGVAAVNATAHPLVALFSAPACMVGNSIRVRFHPMTSGVSQLTNTVPCHPPNSTNFYIAGMYPNTRYLMHYETVSQAGTLVRAGTDLTFNTGSLPGNITVPATSVLTQATLPGSTAAPILLHDYLPVGGGGTIVPIATDLTGNVLWYYPRPVSLLTRTEPGGNMFIIYAGSTNPYQQILREIDLAGNITLETNVNRINQQLTLAGRRHINAFHHEARRLPNGYIAVLGSDEMLVSNAQGGTTISPVDVMGAQVIVLDQDLQLKWAWDAFDHLDISRPSVLGDVCSAGHVGCPVFFLAPTANDWLHANSIQQTTDGNLLISLRHQDWIIKIKYLNGTGDGSVLWRMGYQGDFTLLNPPTSPPCSTPDQQEAYRWFSHQHDANFQLGGNTILSVFDNGNLRRARCEPDGNSRGYVLSVDEANLRATPVLVSDLGFFAFGLGTAELIPGTPNYHFEAGWILPGPFSVSSEIGTAGETRFAMLEAGVSTYRSYRMRDLYTPAQQ